MRDCVNKSTAHDHGRSSLLRHIVQGRWSVIKHFELFCGSGKSRGISRGVSLVLPIAVI